jgi:hypothetical protein
MAKKRGKGRCGCVVQVRRKLKVLKSFDFNLKGWGNAVTEAYNIASGGGPPIDVAIQCDDGYIVMGECELDPTDPGLVSCPMSAPYVHHRKSGPPPIAGLNGPLGRRKGSKKRKKSREKRKKKSGPLTPQQKKFKAAAEACSGKPGYRECVTRHLKG